MTDIRSTTQIVEVVANNDGMARLTQQYVQVLYLESDGNIFEESASNTLVLTQGIAEELLHNAENTLSLSDEATAILLRTISVENELSLSQDVGVFNNTRIGSVLTLTQFVDVELTVAASAQDSLLLTQFVSFVGTKNQLVESVIVITDEVTLVRLLPIQAVESILTLTQSVVDARLVVSQLTLTQSVSVVFGGQELATTSVLALIQSATFESILTVATANALILTQLATNGHIAELIASSALGLTQLAVGTTIDQYMTLYAPYPAVQSAVVLPRAELDDKENSTNSISVRRSMNGIMYTYVKRPGTRMLSYTIDMTRQKGLELQNFFEQHNGKHMKLQNWKGEVWDVQLLTNPLDFVQNRRDGPCGQVGINLQFEGSKISG